MSKDNPQQLLLGVKLNDDATFNNFYVADSNQQLLKFMRAELFSSDQTPQQTNLLCLWGSSSAGKTHLLQALCHSCSESDRSSMYLPMKDCREMAPEILEGLDQLDLVCLDDVDQILGIPAWEQALFHLYNRARESGTAIVISSQTAPQQVNVALPDLLSRLQTALVFQLHSLNDEEKSAMIKMRAEQMGIPLPESVVNFILQRNDREAAALLAVLYQLDRRSLEQKRRITIPLVKQTMGW